MNTNFASFDKKTHIIKHLISQSIEQIQHIHLVSI